MTHEGGWLAVKHYANGGNDNFKGVATLFGSRTASYRGALLWTSIATTIGVVLALFIGSELVIVFKGKGLVPDSVIQMKEFPVAVGLGAALTVMLATRLGLPVSTTHALIGALAGAGWVASEGGVNGTQLASKFFLPLIVGRLSFTINLHSPELDRHRVQNRDAQSHFLQLFRPLCLSPRIARKQLLVQELSEEVL